MPVSCFHFVSTQSPTCLWPWAYAGTRLRTGRKRQKWKREPSRAVVWEREREKMFTSPPPPPPPPLPQCSPSLHSPIFFAVPPNLVPRVFWLVSQRGDARTPLGHRQWWEHSPHQWRRRHVRVEFVVVSLPCACSERFFSGFSGFSLFLKTNTQSRKHGHV